MEHQMYNAEEALAEGGEQSALYRNVAKGGLAVCKICGCFEGGLASECPGAPVSGEEQDRIYSGEVDFVEGRWIWLADGSEFVVRFVVTKPCADGVGRTLFLPMQGRHTHATRQAAQRWIDGYLSNNSASTLAEYGRDLEVRSCRCYTGHFDPMHSLFDMPPLSEIIAKQISPAAR